MRGCFGYIERKKEELSARDKQKERMREVVVRMGTGRGRCKGETKGRKGSIEGLLGC